MTDVEMVGETFSIPRQLGPYLVEYELGSGAMGTVFRAMHTGLDRAVALKVLRPDTLDNPASVRRFLREARSVARLEHPNIVAVYDAGQIGGVYYIAMKLLEGQTLKDILDAAGSLECDRAVRLAAQLASALDYAHEKEVVHLDVKPANVMVANGDRSTLTDFSIAQALNPDATRSAVITGTPLYMSPEQIQGRDVDRRADIYSLGMMLFQMLSGRTPFDGPFVSVMYAHLNTPIPNIRDLVPSVPERVAQVIERATAKDAAERFQTAGEMLHALDPNAQVATMSTGGPERTVVLTGVPLDAELPAEGGRAVAAPIPGRRRLLGRTGLLAAIPLALIAVAVVAFFALRGSSAGPGSVAVSSVPAGASVSLDGVPKGQTPLTLTNVKSGHHVLTLTAPTYNTVRRSIDVGAGKTVKASTVLPSVPGYSLVSASPVFLTTSFALDPATGKAQYGPLLSTMRSSEALTRQIYAIAVFNLKPSVPASRTVRIQPVFTVYSPVGLPLGTLPNPVVTLTLDHHNTQRLFFPRFRFTSKTRPDPGTYRVLLRVEGKVLKELTFSLTSG